MPHGTSDWGLVGPKSTTYGLDDLGEQAVRLGSPHLWDRLGDALALTDFRNGFGPFTAFASGLGGGYGLATGHSRQGAYSVWLRAGSTANWYADLNLTLPRPVTSGIGLEFSFSVPEDTSRWMAFINWYDGVNAWEAVIEYDHVNTRLEYQDHLGVMQEFAAGIVLQEGNQPNCTMKIVVGQTLGEYRRVIFNDTPFPLMGIGVFSWGLPVVTGLAIKIRIEGVAGKNPTGYVDNVIVTHNEP